MASWCAWRSAMEPSSIRLRRRWLHRRRTQGDSVITWRRTGGARAWHPISTGTASHGGVGTKGTGHDNLGWGVPVCSTVVANVDADGELVRMAVSHGAFLHQVETTLAAPPPDPGRFRDHVAANGWRARLEPHVDRLGFERVR